MALYPAPAAVLLPAMLLAGGLASAAAWQRRTGVRASGRAWAASALTVVLLGPALWAMFGSWPRQWPVALGLGLGALAAALWTSVWPARAGGSPHGPVATGVCLLGALGLLSPGQVPFANAALGLLLGWGVPLLAAAVGPGRAPDSPPTDPPFSPGADAAALPIVALVAGTAAWGGKLAPGLAPAPIALGACLALGLALAGLVAPGGKNAWGAVALAAAALALGALACLIGPYAQPWSVLLAVGLGLLLAIAWQAVAPAGADDAPQEANELAPARCLAAVLLVGAGLVVANRLAGIWGIGLAGLALATAARGSAGGRALLAPMLALFAARVWLQLFLDRTSLVGYGVDLTHPYAFATLMLGALWPAGALALLKAGRTERALVVGAAVGLAVLPAWVGYFLHLEALGAGLAGLMLAGFVAAVRPSDGEWRALLPPLVVTTIASCLLAAPWLVGAMNATRQARLLALGGGLAVIAVAGLAGYWRLRRPVPPAPPTAPAAP